jgi:hypothetical protein
MKEDSLSVDTAHWKLNQAMLNPDRWQDALDTMRAVHGQDEANHLEEACRQVDSIQPPIDINDNMDAQRIPASICEAVKALQDEEK